MRASKQSPKLERTQEPSPLASPSNPTRPRRQTDSDLNQRPVQEPEPTPHSLVHEEDVSPQEQYHHMPIPIQALTAPQRAG